MFLAIFTCLLSVTGSHVRICFLVVFVLALRLQEACAGRVFKILRIGTISRQFLTLKYFPPFWHFHRKILYKSFWVLCSASYAKNKKIKNLLHMSDFFEQLVCVEPDCDCYSNKQYCHEYALDSSAFSNHFCSHCSSVFSCLCKYTACCQ